MILGIDPGHGGSSLGTTAGGIIEKRITFELAERLANVCHLMGVHPIMLRVRDEAVTFTRRAALAAASQCDWVISIHVNASAPHQTGAEIYVLKGDRLHERLVGLQILSAMPPQLRTTRVVTAYDDPDNPDDDWKEHPENVIRRYHCPVLLSEVGFASNPDDLAVIDSVWGKSAITMAHASGVARMLEVETTGTA